MSSLPEKFLERLEQMIPQDSLAGVLKSFKRERPVSFRIQKPELDPEQVEKDLKSQGFELESVSWCEGAWILKNKSIRDLQETSFYQQNQIYIQGLSSLIPPLLLEPKSGEKVLDMAAAPGSKATQIALMLNGQGEFHVNEKVRGRFFKLKANMDAQGFKNVHFHLRTGAWFGRFMPNEFDRILLDAPCSSEGRFSTLDPKTYDYWKPHKIQECKRKQKRLLKSAIDALKPSGLLVYATCTFAPEENENVLDWALRKYNDQIELLDFELPVDNFMEALTSWKTKEFNSEIKKAKRILPNENMDAFFIAVLRKM